jgi:hypothetical protein
MELLQATVDRFEEDKAVLILQDGQTLIIDRKYLADNIKEGAIVYLTISLNSVKTETQETEAKKLLQEILKKQNEIQET